MNETKNENAPVEVKETKATKKEEQKAQQLVKLAKELGSSGHSIRPAYVKKFDKCAVALKELETKNIVVAYDITKKGMKVPCPGSKVGAQIDYNQLQFAKAIQKTAAAECLPKSPRYLCDVYRCYFLDKNADTFKKFFAKDTQEAVKLHSAFSLHTFIRSQSETETEEKKA